MNIKLLNLIKDILIVTILIVIYNDHWFIAFAFYYLIIDSLANKLVGESCFYINKDISYIDELKIMIFENYTFTYEVIIKILCLIILFSQF